MSGLRDRMVKGLPHLSNVPVQGVLVGDQCQPAGGVRWCVVDSVSGPSQQGPDDGGTLDSRSPGPLCPDVHRTLTPWTLTPCQVLEKQL